MKILMKNRMMLFMLLLVAVLQAKAQKYDEQKMNRDIEVAENVLQTLMKQEIGSNRTFLGMEMNGTYLPGYGVTFRIPGDFGIPMLLNFEERGGAVVYQRGDRAMTYTYSSDDMEEDERREMKLAEKERSKSSKSTDRDSLRLQLSNKILKAWKDFILDYGDLMSQLPANEKIIITNQGSNRGWYFNTGKRYIMTVEGVKSDALALRQGKINRDQALKKLKVVNTEAVTTKEADLELMSSIITRLYRSDLSTTYYTDFNVSYERLVDYGVIYYMQVYSSSEQEGGRFTLPTVNLRDVDKATRDKKVTELYPKFEQEIKENILEYGRTLKTLKDDEVVAFNITLTKCKDCGIPATLEVSVKYSVLREYGEGKLDKNAAIGKFSIKQGPKQ